jgi:hypothetical protein
MGDFSSGHGYKHQQVGTLMCWKVTDLGCTELHAHCMCCSLGVAQVSGLLFFVARRLRLFDTLHGTNFELILLFLTKHQSVNISINHGTMSKISGFRKAENKVGKQKIKSISL